VGTAALGRPAEQSSTECPEARSERAGNHESSSVILPK